MGLGINSVFYMQFSDLISSDQGDWYHVPEIRENCRSRGYQNEFEIRSKALAAPGRASLKGQGFRINQWQSFMTLYEITSFQ